MATQILEFNATTGLTITAKLFAVESDTVVASTTAVEKTNDKNRYRATYTDIAAGDYRLNGFVGAVGGFANEIYTLTLTSDVFLPLSETQPTFTIIPAIANSPSRATASTIPLFVGERMATSVPVLDANGDALSLVGKTLLFKVETQQREPVLSVVPDISSNTFTFTPNSQLTSSERVLLWCLWESDDNFVIAEGKMPVKYTPKR